MHNAIVSIIWGVPIFLVSVFVAMQYERMNPGHDIFTDTLFGR